MSLSDRINRLQKAASQQTAPPAKPPCEDCERWGHIPPREGDIVTQRWCGKCGLTREVGIDPADTGPMVVERIVRTRADIEAALKSAAERGVHVIQC